MDGLTLETLVWLDKPFIINKLAFGVGLVRYIEVGEVGHAVVAHGLVPAEGFDHPALIYFPSSPTQSFHLKL